MEKEEAARQRYNAAAACGTTVAQKEELGYDLCVFLTEERTAPDPNFERMNALWEDFHKLLGSCRTNTRYYYLLAYEAYCKGDLEDFAAQFDLYLESEKRLYGEVAGCDWWIDCFVWTFTPSFPGMYAKAAELFLSIGRCVPWAGSAKRWRSRTRRTATSNGNSTFLPSR